MQRISTKQTKVAQSIPHVEAKANVADEGGVYEEVMKRYREAQEGLMGFFKLPSWKRTLVAVVTYVAGVVGIGMLTGSLVEFVMVGAVALGAPVFLGIVIAAIAAILLVWQGHKFVMRCAGAVLTKEADERALQAYDACKGLLQRFNPFVKMVPAGG